MASIALVINISTPASSSVSVTPVAPFGGSGTTLSASGPIAAGVTVASIAVQPSGWNGVLSLGGANAGSFTLSGSNLVTAAALAAGTYDVTITATP